MVSEGSPAAGGGRQARFVQGATRDWHRGAGDLQKSSWEAPWVACQSGMDARAFRRGCLLWLAPSNRVHRRGQFPDQADHGGGCKQLYKDGCKTRPTLEQEEGDVERLQLGLDELQAAHHEAKLAGAGAEELGHLGRGKRRNTVIGQRGRHFL